jgi:hypothetical protein
MADQLSDNAHVSSPISSTQNGYKKNDAAVGNSAPSFHTQQQQQQHDSARMAAPQQLNPYYHPPFHVPQQQQTSTTTAAWFAVGTALGLTAAAAVRWINGEDFSWLPPPPPDNDNALVEETNATFPSASLPSTTLNAQDAAAYHNNNTTETMTNILNAMTVQMQQQERILQTMSSRAITDQSMNLLLQTKKNVSVSSSSSSGNSESSSNESSDDKDIAGVNTSSSFHEQLTALKDQVSKLRKELRSKGNNDSLADAMKWEIKLQTTVEQIDDCIMKWNQQQTGPNVVVAATESNADAFADRFNEVEAVSVEFDNTVEPSTPPKASLIVSGYNINKHSADGSLTDSDRACCTDNLKTAIRRLATENEPSLLRVGAQLLYLYAKNLADHHRVPRYRKIFTCNESFQRVDSLAGGRDALLSVGFVEEGNTLEWLPANGGSVCQETEGFFLKLLEDATAALAVLKSTNNASSADLEIEAISALVARSSSLCVVSHGNINSITQSSDSEPDPIFYSRLENDDARPTPLSPAPASGAFGSTPDATIVSPPAARKVVIKENPFSLEPHLDSDTYNSRNDGEVAGQSQRFSVESVAPSTPKMLTGSKVNMLAAFLAVHEVQNDQEEDDLVSYDSCKKVLLEVGHNCSAHKGDWNKNIDPEPDDEDEGGKAIENATVEVADVIENEQLVVERELNMTLPSDSPVHSPQLLKDTDDRLSELGNSLPSAVFSEENLECA